MALPSWLDLGVAARPLPGQAVNGDGYALARWGERVLVVVIDGLGHGTGAAEATAAAKAVVRDLAPAPLADVFAACHAAMARTRGAVMTAALFEPGHVTWAGIGNVDAVLVRAGGLRERILAPGGIVGLTAARVRAATLPIAPGDAVALVTDGIRSAFADDVAPWKGAQALADELLAAHARPEDDALVLVARPVEAP